MKPRLALIVVLLTLSISAVAQSAQTIETKNLIEPGELARILPTAKPLVLMVGPHTLYAQAHIPGAEYVGMTSQPDGIKALRERVQKLPKTNSIVLYCGCCPWDRCPNMAPAMNELKSLGFKNVKALHIAQNFGADWVSKGLPIER
ncbi:MAG TPA: rhodanese-like domain-containing protein [Terriglobales bacterium]|nr:rhodanese-like domain-containing protein [Terriglobales bacterium]